MTQIEIQSSRFGTIEVEAGKIIRFVQPILGFPDMTHFILLDHAPDSPFRWLQSTQEPELAFVVTNPQFFGIEYEFALPQEAAEQLEITDAEDAVVLTVVNIPEENPSLMTANLLGPIVLNQSRLLGMQVVLTDSGFTTKVRLIPDDALKGDVSVSSGASAGE